jgi:hypothetical protein
MLRLKNGNLFDRLFYILKNIGQDTPPQKIIFVSFRILFFVFIYR